MLQEHGLTLQEAGDLSRPDHEVDRAGRFRRNGDGEILFAFGKHRGEIAQERPDYLRWIIGADSPRETKDVAEELL